MHNTNFTWAVIGAGPAGIAAVGKLLDHGVKPQEIAWIDPEFNVGDFGTHWLKVSSNTRVALFLKFFEACKSFQYRTSAPAFAIHDLDPLQTCVLSLAAEPLQWITACLKEQVSVFPMRANKLKLTERHWHIALDTENIKAKNVILAIGAEPKSLALPGIEEVPLYTALDPDKLASTCRKEDTVAVFGASHSAIIILKNLVEYCDVKKVINFYLSPLRYAVYLEDWILFDDTGLKGLTAEWARENIDGKLPAKLERVLSTEQNLQTVLPNCTKAIYAVGFQPRLVDVEGLHKLTYNDKSGIIAPGLFGVGIAFPEGKIDRFGTLEYRVGLWKFMDYLNRVIPIWLRYGT